jgi:hypothetical protein
LGRTLVGKVDGVLLERIRAVHRASMAGLPRPARRPRRQGRTTGPPLQRTHLPGAVRPGPTTAAARPRHAPDSPPDSGVRFQHRNPGVTAGCGPAARGRLTRPSSARPVPCRGGRREPCLSRPALRSGITCPAISVDRFLGRESRFRPRSGGVGRNIVRRRHWLPAAHPLLARRCMGMFRDRPWHEERLAPSSDERSVLADRASIEGDCSVLSDRSDQRLA